MGNILRLADKSQLDRPVILPCELQEQMFFGALRLCKSKICARGAICARSLESELPDLLRPDYVASGSNRRSKAAPNGATTKRGNHKGCLFLLVDHLGLEPRTDRL